MSFGGGIGSEVTVSPSTISPEAELEQCQELGCPQKRHNGQCDVSKHLLPATPTLYARAFISRGCFM